MFATTAPDSSCVMSSRLAMNRLSRSDSSTIVDEQFRFWASVSFADQSCSVAGCPDDRAERRLEVVRY